MENTSMFDFSSIPGALPFLIDGMKVSLQITATAIVVGIVWGTLLAMMRLSSLKPLAWFAAGYVNTFRAIPLVMVLLWFFLIVPRLLESLFGLQAGADVRMASAMTGFALFESAYYAEIIRAGIQSVPRGQIAAAYALGMSYSQAMRLVVLPQAFRNMVPLLLTQAIILFQDTSLVYVSALADYCLSLDCAADFPDHYRPILDVMLGQLVGLFASMRCGLKPDQPSPGGTITRVVSPIKLY